MPRNRGMKAKWAGRQAKAKPLKRKWLIFSVKKAGRLDTVHSVSQDVPEAFKRLRIAQDASTLVEKHDNYIFYSLFSIHANGAKIFARVGASVISASLHLNFLTSISAVRIKYTILIT